MICMVQQAIWLDYHPKKLKKAWGILLEKGRKQDLRPIGSYRVISLLSYMGKLVEKVVAK